jgi:hypothetical protein
MTSETLAQLMIEERNRLQAAIDALQDGSKSEGTNARRKRGRPAKTVSVPTAATAHVIDPLPGLVRKPAKWTAAKRRLQAQRMKQFWAQKKAGKSKGGKGPF